MTTLGETAIVWEGADVLRQWLRPLKELTPSRENARKGEVMELAASYRRYGQVRPILTTRDGTIVAGHHQVLACQELGWTHIAATTNDFKSEEEQRAYLIADNALAQLGGYDEQKLSEQLDFLDAMASNGTLEGTGFTMDSLEDARAAFGKVPETQAPEDLERPYAESANEAAERAAELAQSRKMREVVLLLDGEQYEEFGRFVRVLQKAYATEESPHPGIVACVIRAVGERAAQEPVDGVEQADDGE